MISFENIGLMFQFEAFNKVHNFNKKQSDELYLIATKISQLPTGVKYLAKNLIKYKTLEHEYIEKYISYGGNPDALNKSLRNFEDKSTPILKEFRSAYKNIKQKLSNSN
jgi:hypothetical protein